VSDRPIRLAFTLISRELWAGGYNYQRNLFAALHNYRRGEITPVIFAGMDADPGDLSGLLEIPEVEVAQSNAFDRRGAGLASALILGLDGRAARAFSDRGVDVVFESARFFGWRLPFPAVAWFPDFQHRRLPQLFSPLSRWRREIGFRAQIASGRGIMLSSESAQRDCQKFYSVAADRMSVVRFATQPAPALLAAEPADVIKHYGLPPRYFYLPNQFWRHKNHQVVVDALTILEKRGVDVAVVASGGKDDAREPEYFAGIMRQLGERNLQEKFRYVGMIPLPHVYALLRAATALVNPSRFEGWSTTVEEAKSFGVPLVLSDIDVHREQAGGNARYFATDDPVALADHLAAAMQNAEPVTTRNLVSDLDARVSRFAADFVDTIQAAVARRRAASS
jgi:glycosyltransferase involved in cell wall biosynthesis